MIDDKLIPASAIMKEAIGQGVNDVTASNIIIAQCRILSRSTIENRMEPKLNITQTYRDTIPKSRMVAGA